MKLDARKIEELFSLAARWMSESGRDEIDDLVEKWRLEAKAAPADPLDTPLPCDIEFGSGKIAKGCKLRTLVIRAEALYSMYKEQSAPAGEMSARMPKLSNELYELYPAMSAQSHEEEVQAYARAYCQECARKAGAGEGF